MTQEQLVGLVQQIVKEVLNHEKLSDVQAAPSDKKILVLFSGALIGFDDAIESLKQIREVDIETIQTDSALRILDQSKIEQIGRQVDPKHLVETHDELVVATLTLNLASKAAHGICDCLGSNLISDFLLAGKKVTAAIDGVCPDGAEKRKWFPNIPAGYAAMMRRNLSTLKDIGVQTVRAKNLCRAYSAPKTQEAPEGKRKLITAEVVEGLAPGSVLEIGENDIVTDLAKEVAADAGIELLKRN